MASITARNVCAFFPAAACINGVPCSLQITSREEKQDRISKEARAKKKGMDNMRKSKKEGPSECTKNPPVPKSPFRWRSSIKVPLYVHSMKAVMRHDDKRACARLDNSASSPPAMQRTLQPLMAPREHYRQTAKKVQLRPPEKKRKAAQQLTHHRLGGTEEEVPVTVHGPRRPGEHTAKINK